MIQRVGPGEVHADEPIRAAAGPRRVRQVVEFAAGAQFPETVADSGRRQRRDPEAVNWLVTPRGFVDLPEDEFAFASRVSGADDPLDLGAGQDALDDLELVAAALVYEQRPLGRQHRQGVTAPCLPIRVDLVRLG